jgi:hypothetical protein
VGKRQIEDLAVAAATDIADFYTGRCPGPADAGTLLVLTADGKGGRDAIRGVAPGDRQSRRCQREQAGHSPVARGEGQP